MNEYISRNEWLTKSNKPIFSVMGGTWLMQAVENKFRGVGHLGDTEIAQLENACGYNEKKFAGALHKLISEATPINMSPQEFFPWLAPEITEDLDFDIVPVLACDSSHRRNSFASVLLFDELQTALHAPSRQRMRGMGTDTQWLSIAEADPFLFDSNTAGSVTQGTQKPFAIHDSDAPSQFEYLFRTLKLNLIAGSFLQWSGWLYPGSDVNKNDPAELAIGYSRPEAVFKSPHQTHQSLLTPPFGGRFHQGNQQIPLVVPNDHVINRINDWEDVYNTRKAVLPFDVVVSDMFEDLDDLRRVMLSPKNRGIVIAGTGLCNVSNPVKIVATEAAKEGKLVMGVSGCPIGQTAETYVSVSLLGANHSILNSTSTRIIDGGVLSIHSARGILMRALLDGLDQTETQNLVDSYLRYRFPATSLPNFTA